MRRLNLAFSILVVAACFFTQPRAAQAQDQPSYCATCQPIGCEPGWYLIQRDPSGTYYWPFNDFCQSGSCPSGSCFASQADGAGPSPNDIARRISVAVARGDVRLVDRLLERSRYAYVNYERRAIQVRSCDRQTIIAHIPVNSQVWVALVSRPDRIFASLPIVPDATPALQQ